MKTIEIYEKSKSDKLKKMLKFHENVSRLIDLKLRDFNLSEKQYLKYKNISSNCDIDIQLIRMELNKRLWYNNLEK